MNVLFFLLTACFWGGSFIAIKPLVEAMPPLMAGTLRMAVSLIILAALFPLLKISFKIPRELRARVWINGLMAFGIPFALLFWGEKSITPGLAGILNGTVPLWVYILGLTFTPGVEPVTTRKTVGLACGMAGLLCIFLPKILVSSGDSSLAGAMAVALMAVCYASGVLINRSIFSVKHATMHPFTNLFHQLLTGFGVLLLISLAFEGWPDPSTWHPLQTVVLTELYLGGISTTLAFMMFYRLIREWGSVRASTVTYVVPAVTLGLDLAINQHLPQINDVFGVLGVTAGVVILNLPVRKVSSQKTATTF